MLKIALLALQQLQQRGESTSLHPASMQSEGKAQRSTGLGCLLNEACRFLRGRAEGGAIQLAHQRGKGGASSGQGPRRLPEHCTKTET